MVTDSSTDWPRRRSDILGYVLERDRWATIALLLIVAGIGLTATKWTGDMLMSPLSPPPNSLAYGIVLFIMWWSMMVAMMLPSAAPAILTYRAMLRRLAGRHATAMLVAFVLGYLAIWTGFSLIAVLLQIATHGIIRLTGMMALTSAVIGAALLIAVGLYQLSPLKLACLRRCQTPLMFFARNWRNDSRGAFLIGVRHGIFCLGCCWALMTLLFYGGVMELNWIVGLALYVLLEKLMPAGSRLSRYSGAFLIAWGLWALLAATR
jgi:predicted metal-binding membrane protein